VATAIARLTSSDYEAWRREHTEAIKSSAEAFGLVSEVIYRDHDDPDVIVLVQELESTEKAQAFLASPAFQGLVDRAPVEAPPSFWFLDKVEEITDAKAVARSG
jgi:quinol monooxygenase YgiN